ncbi:NAD(P)H-quinone oxidoreductase subunit N [Synechococcus sp. PCC 7336]|uniref:NAD(P)H-quinone oxidoreductase subunit N n=1 Tax=Synechococcus sp. PCC 7336 TaxID=195250 RepID=UPI000348A16D|nr:NAD(P)H-quinone oxidoreductase subunit N [Synechococcus sp. PCC 7336]
MLLIGSGNKFVKALERAGVLAASVPPEGGSEGHYRRRVAGAGYQVVHMSARGLGDITSFFQQIHGVCPAHLGKSNLRTYYFPPLIEQYRQAMPPQKKGLVFWLIEGQFLSRQELSCLQQLSRQEPQVKFVIEVESDRVFRYQPLENLLKAIA